PKEIIFTSGATESDNLALKGVAEMYAEKGNHIITCLTEHKAVLDSAKKLEKQGFRITWLPVQPSGRIDLDRLRDSITDQTILITLMYANNEIGVLQPVEEIGRLAHERGVLFHCDAVQAVGKVPVNVIAENIDLLSISAHKMYGPKGVGALYVRRPGIVGLGEACALCQREMAEEAVRLAALRDRLRARLEANLDEVYINGTMEHRLPNNLSMSFAYVEGESLLMGINDVAVSSGSACTSATLEPSYVLKALGAGDDLAHSSIRFGLGRFNTEAEVDYVAGRVTQVVSKLRELSPLYEMAKEGIDVKNYQWSSKGH
ncbi:MAG: aminotransferase class V-fold PLP-dependent enzyme, partial [Acidobacteria bacterium]|nr:aminotransferase class V-fold PLP-dependent enzyme [Acidobacteriota bacterium]